MKENCEILRKNNGDVNFVIRYALDHQILDTFNAKLV